jgi:cobalt/nickel transport system ATP-binding protein
MSCSSSALAKETRSEVIIGKFFAASMSDRLLEMRDVYYTYPLATAPAVRGLSCSIQRQRRTALIGRNGCGKSTMFLLADGLCRPERGEICLDGVVLGFDRPTLNRWRQRVGLVFQDPEQQLVAPTVEADISYGLCNQGLPMPEVERRVQQTLVDFHLTELARSPLHHLSLGQKKRVSIAGVMTLQPDLLLLDEPTAYLDPVQTRNLLVELEAIEQAGTTLLIATHDLDFVYQWADWVMVMDGGQLLLEGETLEVFEQLHARQDYSLGLPLLWQMWQALPLELRKGQVPRSIEQFTNAVR